MRSSVTVVCTGAGLCNCLSATYSKLIYSTTYLHSTWTFWLVLEVRETENANVWTKTERREKTLKAWNDESYLIMANLYRSLSISYEFACAPVSVCAWEPNTNQNEKKMILDPRDKCLRPWWVLNLDGGRCKELCGTTALWPINEFAKEHRPNYLLFLFPSYEFWNQAISFYNKQSNQTGLLLKWFFKVTYNLSGLNGPVKEATHVGRDRFNVVFKTNIALVPAYLSSLNYHRMEVEVRLTMFIHFF